jgi:hypothetical protein
MGGVSLWLGVGRRGREILGVLSLGFAVNSMEIVHGLGSKQRRKAARTQARERPKDYLIV